MDPREGLRIAVRAVTGHRLRSTLTVVGIVIGIATVITFASFGASVQSDVVSEFQGTSASEIYVLTDSLEPQTGDGGDGPPTPPSSVSELGLPAITDYDIEQLATIDGVTAVIPQADVPAVSLTVNNETVGQSTLTATSPAAFDDNSLVAGRAFDADAEGELVLSEAVVSQFSTNVSVGEQVTVDFGDRTETATVVGITSGARGGIGGDFSGFGPAAYVPTTYYETTVESPANGVDQRAYTQVTLVAEAGRVPETQERVQEYFRSGGDSDAAQILGDNSNVTVQSTADIVEGIQSVLEDITRLVTGIGVLALLVGAFGIANIMLVSVTERTKEIGIMKAIGAHNREVMGLFLTEAVLLGLAGAVVGIPAGLGVGYVAATYAEVGFTIPYGWIAIAVGMGITIGVVAGLYPAWRAARVDPIEALRYE